MDTAPDRAEGSLKTRQGTWKGDLLESVKYFIFIFLPRKVNGNTIRVSRTDD